MKAYVVVSNGPEIQGYVEGVYLDYGNAKAKFDSIVDDWRGHKSDNSEETVREDFYNLIDFEEDESLQVRIVEREAEGR